MAVSQVFLEDRPRGSACAFYVAWVVATAGEIGQKKTDRSGTD